jgi:Ca2+-binding RTX toxin-like protein
MGQPTATVPIPDPVLVDNLWDLAADPGAVDAAAQAWRALGAGCDAARDLVDAKAAPLRGDAWSGDTADTYHDHRAKLGRGVDDVVAAASGIAAALDATAGALASAQSLLADALARVSARVPASVAGGRVRFAPRTPDDLPAVTAAVAEAQRIRADLDGDLLGHVGRIEKARPLLAGVSSTWDSIAGGRTDGWRLPPEAAGLGWIYDGDTVVVNTGPGDDTVEVSVDPATGEQVVTVNGTTVRFPAGREITVRAGEGNDTVNVAAGTRVNLTLLGGEGDDTLRGGAGSDRILGLDGRDHVEARGGGDRVTTGASRDHLPGEDPSQPVVEHADGGAGDDAIWGGAGGDSLLGGDGKDRAYGGAGDDTVDGGAGDDAVYGGAGTDNVYGRDGNDAAYGGEGRDYVDGGAGDDRLAGGLGDDTVYGLSGADRIDGGAGRDYLEGGRGDDTIDGGAGNDAISGGRDNDTLRGGGGDDRFYTGPGRDAVDAGGGADTVYGQAEDDVRGAEQVVTVQITDVASYIRIEGSPEFVDRVEADLDMLRASPTGQQMLGNLEKAHEDSKHWFYGGDGLTIRETRDENGYARSNPGWFGHQHPQIDYNPSFDTLYDGPPVVVLYHEMAHVYDYVNDTLDDGTYNRPDNPDTPNRERVAAGLPIDHDDDQGTPDRIDPEHPIEYTENGLRAELGAPHRPRY